MSEDECRRDALRGAYVAERTKGTEGAEPSDGQSPDEPMQHAHDVLRAHFAERAEDIQPSVELARRVSTIRPSTRKPWPSMRLSVLAFGGVAIGAAAAVALLFSHPASTGDRPSPLAPPSTSAHVI